jgi:radical SAM protein with 4Fe4S-binding SPASM domain
MHEAVELGVREIALVGGGEPLVRERTTLKIMSIAKSNGLIGDLVTNGTLFTPASIKKIVEMRWDRIKFSVDGPDAETHDYLRNVPGSFDAVTTAIRLFSKYKAKTHSDKPRLIFNTVMSNRNYMKLPEMYELAHELGCEEFLILPLTIFSPLCEQLKIQPHEMDDVQQYIRRAMDIADEHGMSTNINEFLQTELVEKTNVMNEVIMADVEDLDDEYEGFIASPCFDPWHHVSILANGNVGPCYSDLANYSVENIKNKSLADIWYGEYFNDIRRRILDKNLPESCATCCVWKVFDFRRIREALKEFHNRMEGCTVTHPQISMDDKPLQQPTDPLASRINELKRELLEKQTRLRELEEDHRKMERIRNSILYKIYYYGYKRYYDYLFNQ